MKKYALGECYYEQIANSVTQCESNAMTVRTLTLVGIFGGFSLIFLLVFLLYGCIKESMEKDGSYVTWRDKLTAENIANGWRVKVY